MASEVFHADVYDRRHGALSWWAASAPGYATAPLEGDTAADVAIIGGGYCGLSAALHLARDHGLKAVVLEAGDIGWGASGGNGGFVTYPAMKRSAEDLVATYGLDTTRAVFAAGRAGVECVRDLIATEGLEVEPQGDAVFEVAHSPRATAEVRDMAELYRDILGLPASFLPREAFTEIGHGGREQFGAMRLGECFALHPMKFVTGLAAAAEGHGAVTHGRSAVTGWRREGAGHRLVTGQGSVTAPQVIVAANGYLPNDLDARLDNRMIPALSNILVTRSLSEAELAAEGWRTECPVNNVRDLLFYYRLLPDRRFLFGARGGTWGDPAEMVRMRRWLHRRMGEVFASWADVEADYFWSGLVALSSRRTPVVTRLEDDRSVHVAYGCHGSGVALMPWAGRAIARSIAGVTPIEDLPAPYRGLSSSLGWSPLRRWGLKAAYVWYGLKDDSGS